ncbi:WhiA LAGLIDADG-like domain protein [Acididesulfobacillus acetoxydans]|uniref:Probable cell division protein WhiA n=1 Tax=Acididesulfobacillus acetoxydans TaxID=1561005 RepID=A0A8S0W1P9_9FIRM|nr:DNA-binding protein WhiA [Acididesulfobacillus acetoxydans]CAA7599688.1 WhiA LAGLIDADG-like domain protein [Acididesulfobacillus acetoxydans]CEJ06240.1 Sporulation regulator WhiA [Acididesulfobacillus acetoxydans]
MSFSATTKEELARVTEHSPSAELAELAALVRMDGTLQISSHREYALNVTTENAAVARKVYRLAKNVLGGQVDIVVRRKLRLRKNNSYLVRIYPRGVEDLQRLGLLDEDALIQPGICGSLVRRRGDQKAYLRGAFLAGGSINNPEGTYHLEIITNDLGHAQALCGLINKFRLGAKVSARKNWHVVYIKESEHIVGFLALVGAHHALLEFENVRVFKEMRNQVNRLVNCETANLNKTVDAAVRQVDNIRLVADTVGFTSLPEALRQVAQARLEYPDASLKELGEMLRPQVGKSGVNHRLRKIDELAESIRLKGYPGKTGTGRNRSGRG